MIIYLVTEVAMLSNDICGNEYSFFLFNAICNVFMVLIFDYRINN